MKLARSSGVLCHVTSLPSRFGVGDLGPEAYRFADFLREAKQSRWQVLPLNPTSLGMSNSPYGSDSAFAGDALVISPERLIEEEILTEQDLADAPRFPEGHVDYRAVRAYRDRLLDLAWSRLATAEYSDDFEWFLQENHFWLETTRCSARSRSTWAARAGASGPPTCATASPPRSSRRRTTGRTPSCGPRSSSTSSTASGNR